MRQSTTFVVYKLTGNWRTTTSPFIYQKLRLILTMYLINIFLLLQLNQSQKILIQIMNTYFNYCVVIQSLQL